MGVLLVPRPEPYPSDLPGSQCLRHPFVVEPALAVNTLTCDRSVSMDNGSCPFHRHERIRVIVGIIDGAWAGKELFVHCMPDRGREGGECQIKALVFDPERKPQSGGRGVFVVKTISSDTD